MNEFVSKLLSGNIVEAKEFLDTRLNKLVSEKLEQKKLQLAAEVFEETGLSEDYELVFEDADLNEFVVSGYGKSNMSKKPVAKSTVRRSNTTRMGRTKLIRVRVRQGKVQRRKKFSAVTGYTIRSGKMTRMSATERRNRKMGSRRSKFKRRAKLRQALRKRKMSLRRRHALGL